MITPLNIEEQEYKAMTITDATAENNPKVTDNTTSTTYELLKTITITPAVDEYVEIVSVYAEIAMNKLSPGGVTITLGTKIIGLDANPVDTHSRGVGTASSVSWCTNNEFTGDTRTVTYRGGIGEAVTIEYYLKSSSAVNPDSYCIRNANAIHKLIARKNVIE